MTSRQDSPSNSKGITRLYRLGNRILKRVENIGSFLFASTCNVPQQTHVDLTCNGGLAGFMHNPKKFANFCKKVLHFIPV